MQVEQELLDLHTGRPLTESDYTGCCINTIDPLMMNTCLLETCRGLKYTYYIKELCVHLVTYQRLYQEARSAKYSLLQQIITANLVLNGFIQR